MLYEVDITIPANTSADSPTEQEILLNTGLLTQIEVQIPAGCRGLVHTTCRANSHQQWPSNNEGTIKGDNALIKWAENLRLEVAPVRYVLLGWSPGTDFAHILTWRFNVLPMPSLSGEKMPVVTRVKRLFSG